MNLIMAPGGLEMLGFTLTHGDGVFYFFFSCPPSNVRAQEGHASLSSKHHYVQMKEGMLP